MKTFSNILNDLLKIQNIVRRFVNLSLHEKFNLQMYLDQDTGEPMSRQTKYRLMRARCFDSDDEDNWEWTRPTRRKNMTKTRKANRLMLAQKELRDRKAEEWWHDVVMIDPVHQVLPQNEERLRQIYAPQGPDEKGWMSKKSKNKPVRNFQFDLKY